MTLGEYFRTPETVLPRELAFGVLRVADAPAPPHQRAVARLFLALHEAVQAQALGEVWLSPVDVILDADLHLVVQPDLVFVSRAREHIVRDRIRGAPDLVIEVLSPRPRIGTLAEHLEWFAESGVGECWVVDLTAKVVDVIRFRDGATAGKHRFEARTPIRSAVVPTFARSLDSILT
jgi:Uma2 family endonuclease